jgi:hypothetical protein
VSVYALAWGIGETEWSMSGDSCISRSDQPPDARGYRVAPSSSPPWGVVCTYDLEGGRTITLPQWYPQRGLPYVAGTVGLSLLYLVSLATSAREPPPPESSFRARARHSCQTPFLESQRWNSAPAPTRLA